MRKTNFQKLIKDIMAMEIFQLLPGDEDFVAKVFLKLFMEGRLNWRKL